MLPLGGMYLVPAAIFIWLEIFQRGFINIYTIVFGVILGVSSIAFARWPLWIRLTAAVIYMLTSAQILLFLTFVGTCIVSDCLP
ncbi:hypothetical protein MHZ93_05090 [Roseomonas sp. ACRSG]|nr:hypothetical protein [Roseomonas sp. ACRSG]